MDCAYNPTSEQGQISKAAHLRLIPCQDEAAVAIARRPSGLLAEPGKWPYEAWVDEGQLFVLYSQSKP